MAKAPAVPGCCPCSSGSTVAWHLCVHDRRGALSAAGHSQSHAAPREPRGQVAVGPSVAGRERHALDS